MGARCEASVEVSLVEFPWIQSFVTAAMMRSGLHIRLCARIRKKWQFSGFLNEARTPAKAGNFANGLKIKGFAMEMTLRVRDDETPKPRQYPALGAWKPAQDAADWGDKPRKSTLRPFY